MNQIEFMFVLLNKWYDKVAYGSITDVKKVYSDYSDYCLVNGLSPQSEENLVSFIEKCKYDELPIATRHDIYRAAQKQLLIELMSLQNNPSFVRDFDDVVSAELTNRNSIEHSPLESALHVIYLHLADCYDEDKSIDTKLKNLKVRWDSSVG